MIPFGEWLPDRPELNNPGSLTAKNCIPYADHYRPFSAPAVITGALASRAMGSVIARDSAGVGYVFAGDAAKLYKLASGTFGDVSKAAGYAATNWEFAQYGTRVIATNYTDNPQSFVLGSSSLFADLTTTLKAKHIAVVRDFVMLGNTYDASDGARPEQVWWSAIDNPTDYTIAAATQCDKQLIAGSGGAVQKIVGGEFALIFQERAIVRATYVGSPLIFQFDVLEQGRGCFAPGSVAKAGSKVFYLAEDGFYMTNGSGESVPISEGKVSKTFFADFDQSSLDRLSALIDPINSLYLVSYPGQGGGGSPNAMLAYHWPSGRWAKIEPGNHEIMAEYATQATALDSLAVSLDTSAYADMPIDSRSFIGGARMLGCFDADHKLATFNGAALTAVIETPEAQINPGRRSIVKSVTPLVTGGGAVSIEIGTRSKMTDSVSWTGATTVNSEGEAHLFADGRYHRARVTITGGFEQAFGIDADAVATGKY